MIMTALPGPNKELVRQPFDRHVTVLGEGSETVFEAVWAFVEKLKGEREKSETEQSTPPS